MLYSDHPRSLRLAFSGDVGDLWVGQSGVAEQCLAALFRRRWHTAVWGVRAAAVTCEVSEHATEECLLAGI
jgi:hypothetical protein